MSLASPEGEPIDGHGETAQARVRRRTFVPEARAAEHVVQPPAAKMVRMEQGPTPPMTTSRLGGPCPAAQQAVRRL